MTTQETVILTFHDSEIRGPLIGDPENQYQLRCDEANIATAVFKVSQNPLMKEAVECCEMSVPSDKTAQRHRYTAIFSC